MVHRDLYEVINPQPRALAVIRRLLDWISRVDMASQRGSVRPPFATSDGEPIFPGEDELWWLTEVQRKKPDSTEAGDEDGPASEHEDDKEQTDDEDRLSDVSSARGDEHEEAQASQFKAEVAWQSESCSALDGGHA